MVENDRLYLEEHLYGQHQGNSSGKQIQQSFVFDLDLVQLPTFCCILWFVQGIYID